MMRLRLSILATLLAAAICGQAEPQDSTVLRPATVTVAIDAGATHSLDTYLSPLFYDGMHLRIGFERQRASRFNPERWTNKIEAGFTYDHPSNPAGNNSLHTIIADVDFAMLHRWRVAQGLTLHAGAGIGFRGGVTYNPRNSNNVCSPLIRLYAGASAIAAHRFNAGRLPMTLR